MNLISENRYLKMIASLLLALTIVAILDLLVPRYTHDDTLSIKNIMWVFGSGSELQWVPIVPAAQVSEQVPDRTNCCNGAYEFTVESKELERFQTSPNSLGALYIPAIGGTSKVFLNGMPLELKDDDRTSSGPVVPLVAAMARDGKFHFRIEMEGRDTFVFGLWKSYPIIGELFNLERIKSREYLYQVLFPAFASLFLLVTCAAFLYIYVSTEKKFVVYRYFAYSVASWSLFEFVLSGIPRRLAPHFGAVIHLPMRSLAALGTYILLVGFIARLSAEPEAIFKKFKIKYAAIFTALLVCMQLFWDFGQNIKAEIVVFAFVSFLSFLPLLFWPRKNMKLASFQFLSFTFALAAFIAQCSDCVKLLSLSYAFPYPMAFFDRYSSTMLLSFSIIVNIQHLVEYHRLYESKIEESARDAAIAGTITMLAHDLRRPFSFLKMGLKLLRSGKTFEDMHKVLAKLEPEIEKSTAKVNAMLSDIMESGRTSEIHTEPWSLFVLILSALVEVKRSKSDVKVRISGALNHKHLMMVDAHKIQRVLANLIANAVEATGSASHIWINTSESVPGGLVEITVGNEGSFIPEENLGRLFTPYFTKGKKAGTGLGLAICKKIVEGHGGAITCVSSQGSGTEFTFSLACSIEFDGDRLELPASFAEIEDVIG